MRKLFVKGSEISATNDGILQEKEAIADSNLNSVTIRDDKTIGKNYL